MLLQNKPPHVSHRSKIKSSKSVKPKKNRTNERAINSSRVNNRQVEVSHQQQKFTDLPLWLQTLLFAKNISSFCCYLSVASALFLYGMTVYAPDLWTEKYEYLKDLQKKERQLTFNDETIKNQLANTANEPSSGLIDPDPTKPAIFLPETKIKPIEQVGTKQPLVKTIERIYPIAY